MNNNFICKRVVKKMYLLFCLDGIFNFAILVRGGDKDNEDDVLGEKGA